MNCITNIRYIAAQAPQLEPGVISTLPETRTDGRSDLDIRELRFQSGLVADASGSVYLELGGTRVLCSVRGPRAVSSGSVFSDTHGILECELKCAPWYHHADPSATSSSNIMNQTERQWAQHLLDALEPAVMLEKYPKAAISINIAVLQSCGGELSAAVTVQN